MDLGQYIALGLLNPVYIFCFSLCAVMITILWIMLIMKQTTNFKTADEENEYEQWKDRRKNYEGKIYKG